MRLGIHGWRLCAERTGVGRYLRNVVREWRVDDTHRFTDIRLYTPRPLDADDESSIDPSLSRVVLPSPSRMLVWENLHLGPRTADDVLFCPSFSRPLLARARTVVATHDMVYRVQPQLFPASSRGFYRLLYEWSDRHATLIVTDAEAVKEEIIHFCRVPADRVRVTYLAPAAFFRPVQNKEAVAAARRRVLGADVPCFLFVGKTTGRRSLPLVLDGFAQLCRRTRRGSALPTVSYTPDSSTTRP